MMSDEINKIIYLDYNATTPISKEVGDSMIPYIFDYWGNPSSSHSFGVAPKEAVKKARQQVADILKCRPTEIIFTSGGTESNNWAVKGVAERKMDSGRHIVTSTIEHPAIIEVCKYLERSRGFNVSYVPVSKDGVIDIGKFEQEITDKTILVTIMHANNETGTIQPIKELVSIAKRKNSKIIFHTDASQTIGKIPTFVDDLGVDLLTIVGHKLYAPKGVGALYIREGTELETFMHGAKQENGLRAGTENVVLINGLGTACSLISNNMQEYVKAMTETRDLLLKKLLNKFPLARVNGNPQQCLPNTLSLAFPGCQALDILKLLQNKVAASAGSACHSDSVHMSPVLIAMNVPKEYAFGTIRFSTGIVIQYKILLESLTTKQEEILRLRI
eukprot:TRINITY_DN5478_c0_g1_i2.p1 TRINITY_DN5478_c0_g1~~TRINITY_DN5478_c0_g1_i2.p1  ORF type:complete len:388 (-),score=53.97 TRINITY_DN5478_c0_g1_i2:88-1251(-)